VFAVDVGGTFTDVVAVVDGTIRTAKVSTDYRSVHGPILEGAATLGVSESDVFNHASTHGLNAVITRNLPKIGFLTTEGHRDILDMGQVWRPAHAILDPHWRRGFGDAARPLVSRYLRRGIRERITSKGDVLFQLDERQAREQLEVLRNCSVQGIAICLINAYVNPSHEQRLREVAYEVLGDIPCSISSEVSPLAREYPRASTTVIDTFMKIIYTEYSENLEKGLANLGFNGQLNFADCAATLVPVERAMDQPFRIVFSGPSAGTVASAHFGELTGEGDLLCADIGGTSCDISVVTDGQPFVNTSFELEHDLVVNALATDISAIGAGGGSLVAIGASGEITVGPGSAGADPGPACYGRGGIAPTTTDTCVMIGIVDPDKFAGGRVRLDKKLSYQAFENLDCDLSLAQRVRYAYEVAVQNIAEGLFNVAIKNGVDPRDYSLVAYGAAGPMLLPAVLDTLQCKQVIIPPFPGLFSALGLLSADQVYTVNRSAYTKLDSSAARLINGFFCEMEDQLRDQLKPGTRVKFERSFDGHLMGQSWDTPFVPVPDGQIDGDAIEVMIEAFHTTYQARSGNRFNEMAVEGVTFRVRAVLDTPKVTYQDVPSRGTSPLHPIRMTTLNYLGDLESAIDGVDAPVYDRASLCRGDVIKGPAIVVEELSTTHVCAGLRAEVGRFGELIIRKGEKDAR